MFSEPTHSLQWTYWLLTLLSLLSVVRLPLVALSTQTGIHFVPCRWRSANTLSHPNLLDPGRRAATSVCAFHLISFNFVPFRAIGPQECLRTNLWSTLTPRTGAWKSHTLKTTGGATGLRCPDSCTAMPEHSLVAQSGVS